MVLARTMPEISKVASYSLDSELHLVDVLLHLGKLRLYICIKLLLLHLGLCIFELLAEGVVGVVDLDSDVHGQKANKKGLSATVDKLVAHSHLMRSVVVHALQTHLDGVKRHRLSSPCRFELLVVLD